MKRIFSVLIACLLAACFAVPALAEPVAYVIDWAEVLSDVDALDARAAEIYKTTGAAVAVVSVDGEASTSEIASEVWNDYVAEDEGAILVFNTETNKYYIGLQGSLYDISDDQFQALCSAYDDAATYQGGAADFIEAVYGLIDPAMEGETATEDASDPAAEDDSQPEETTYYRLVVDEAGVLTEEQEETLSQYAEGLFHQYGYDVVIYLAESLHQRDAQALADDFYDYNGYGVGDERSGILMMICPSQRKYAFSTRGGGYRMFDGARFTALEDATVDQMKNGDWYQAAMNYLTTCERCFTLGVPEEEKPNLLAMTPIGIVFGFLMSFLPVGSMKRKLKSVAKKQEASNYIKENGIEIARSDDQFVNMIVTRTPIQQSSSGDGGRGAHTSSSGATHGGRSGSF